MSEKKVIYITFIIVVLVTLVRVFTISLNVSDESVNYYNTLKIYNGERMWEEVNIITTPFLFILGNIFFKVFGTKFIIYRFINAIVNIAIFSITYKTFRNLKVDTVPSLIYTIIIYALFLTYITIWGLTYNILAILFCLIGVNLNLTRKNIQYYNLWQGIIIFLVIFTKQNIGLFYAISQIITELILEEKWIKVSNLLRQFSIVILGGLLFFIYLLKSKLLDSFIDLTILGLGTFSDNKVINYAMILISALLILFVLFIVLKKKYEEGNRDNIIILTVPAVMMLFMSYPLADTWHMFLASIVLYIESIYIIHSNGFKLDSKVYLVIANVYLVLFIVSTCIATFLCFNTGDFRLETDMNSNFYLTIFRDVSKMENIKNFILLNDKNVLMISADAGVYNIILNMGSHGFFDEPFNGNLGSNQLEKVKEKLKDYEDCFIMLPHYNKIAQEIPGVREYLNDNYSIITEISGYTVYKK